MGTTCPWFSSHHRQAISTSMSLSGILTHDNRQSKPTGNKSVGVTLGREAKLYTDTLAESRSKVLGATEPSSTIKKAGHVLNGAHRHGAASYGGSVTQVSALSSGSSLLFCCDWKFEQILKSRAKPLSESSPCTQHWAPQWPEGFLTRNRSVRAQGFPSVTSARLSCIFSCPIKRAELEVGLRVNSWADSTGLQTTQRGKGRQGISEDSTAFPKVWIASSRPP